jgi:general secretion pathway protein G
MRRNQRAFTLLEIMIVVSIIAVLLSLAIYKLKGNLEAAKSVGVQADIQSIRTQLRVYESFNGFLPTTEQGLQALVTRPSTDPQPSRWNQLFDSVPKDPWHNDYIYLNPGRKNPSGYDLYSAGPDRQPDTADDDWGGS